MCVVDGTLVVSVIVVVVGFVVDETLVVRGSVAVSGVLLCRECCGQGSGVIFVPPTEVGPEKENKKIEDCLGNNGGEKEQSAVEKNRVREDHERDIRELETISDLED
ncbi:hypothetical protein Bca101_036888 [Brassica carinata]